MSSRLPEKAGHVPAQPLAPGQGRGKLSPRAQGWSQPCTVMLLSSMTCDTLIGNDLLHGGGETCRTGEGGASKGASSGRKALWHSRPHLDLLFIGCICRYLANQSTVFKTRVIVLVWLTLEADSKTKI